MALTADPDIVKSFAEQLLAQPPEKKPDPVHHTLAAGRRQALRIVASKGNKKGPNLLAEEPGQTQKGLHDSIPS